MGKRSHQLYGAYTKRWQQAGSDNKNENYKMNSFLSILYNSKNTFDYLDNKFSEQLNKISIFLFFTYGLLTPFVLEFPEGTILTTDDPKIVLLIKILTSTFGGVMSVILYKYVITNVLYGIGKLLKGKSEWIDIQTVVAYSLIPIILLKLIYAIPINFESVPIWILMTTNGILFIISVKIIIQGLMKFNNFGITKSILNYSPILLISVLDSVFVFYNMF